MEYKHITRKKKKRTRLKKYFDMHTGKRKEGRKKIEQDRSLVIKKRKETKIGYTQEEKKKRKKEFFANEISLDCYYVIINCCQT